MLSRIWQYISGAAVVAAAILYALWQRSRAERATRRAQRADIKAERMHKVAQARHDARKRAEKNKEAVRAKIRNRSAGLNNDRL